MKNRRQFLAQSAVGLLTVATLPTTTFAANALRPHNSKVTSLAHLNFHSFQNLRNREFHVAVQGNRTVALGLIQVKSHAPVKGEHFTLRFAGPSSQPLAQGTFRFDHAELGVFEMMIVPGQMTATRQAYAAVINRTV